MSDTNSPAERLAALLQRTVQQLDELDAPDEALGVMKQGRGIGPLRSAPAIAPTGRAWRLGVLLLDREANLSAVGSLTRAVEPGRVTNQSPAFEVRRSYKAAALRGRFAPGEVVNFGHARVELDDESLARASGPLFLSETGVVMVRWSRDAARPLEDYLAEHVRLHVPE